MLTWAASQRTPGQVEIDTVSREGSEERVGLSLSGGEASARLRQALQCWPRSLPGATPARAAPRQLCTPSFPSPTAAPARSASVPPSAGLWAPPLAMACCQRAPRPRCGSCWDKDPSLQHRRRCSPAKGASCSAGRLGEQRPTTGHPPAPRPGRGLHSGPSQLPTLQCRAQRPRCPRSVTSLLPLHACWLCFSGGPCEDSGQLGWASRHLRCEWDSCGFPGGLAGARSVYLGQDPGSDGH